MFNRTSFTIIWNDSSLSKVKLNLTQYVLCRYEVCWYFSYLLLLFFFSIFSGFFLCVHFSIYQTVRSEKLLFYYRNYNIILTATTMRFGIPLTAPPILSCCRRCFLLWFALQVPRISIRSIYFLSIFGYNKKRLKRRKKYLLCMRDAHMH